MARHHFESFSSFSAATSNLTSFHFREKLHQQIGLLVLLPEAVIPEEIGELELGVEVAVAVDWREPPDGRVRGVQKRGRQRGQNFGAC